MWIGGKHVDTAEKIEVRCPYDDALIDTVPRGTPEHVEEAVRAAARAREVMRRMPLFRRSQILAGTAAELRRNRERIATVLCEEVGKTMAEAQAEVERSAQIFDLSAEEARRLHGETIPFDAIPSGEHRLGYFRRVPVGVVAAITPFNVPLALAAHKVGPAVAGGNPVVLKPATTTPLNNILLVEAMLEAGMPPEAISVVTGPGGSVGASLASHPEVRLVSFTGSRPVGEALTRSGGLKKVVLELGGNAAVIVTDSADLERAVAGIVRGGYGNAGQNCIAVQRVLVDRRRFDELMALLVPRVKAIRTGDPRKTETDMGPVITRGEAERVHTWIRTAVEKGATLHAGGERDGAVVTPALLTGVPHDHPLWTDEVFGPVVLVEAYEGFDRAIELANDSEHGLQAGIFTEDVEEALEAADRLEVGGVMINEVSTYRADFMPYGGVKASGLGREGVRFALEEMTEPKVVCFTRRIRS